MRGYISVTEYVLSNPSRHDGTKAISQTPPVVLSPTQASKSNDRNNNSSPPATNNGQKPVTGSPSLSSSGEKVKTGIQFYTSNWSSGGSTGSVGGGGGDKSPTLTAGGGARILNWVDVMNQSKSEEQQRLDQVIMKTSRTCLITLILTLSHLHSHLH